MKNKGISLIVLIITIVVIIILATAIIVNLAQTNIIGNSNEAVVKQDFKAMQEELNLYIADEFANTKGKLDITTVDASTVEEVKKILKSSSNSKYIEYVRIVDGKIVFVEGIDNQVKEWADEVLNSKGNTVVIPTPEETGINIEVTPESQTEGYVEEQIVNITATSKSGWSSWSSKVAITGSKTQTPSEEEWEALTLSETSDELKRSGEVTVTGETEGEYYLWLKITTNGKTQTSSYGPYKIGETPKEDYLVCTVIETKENETVGIVEVGSIKIYSGWKCVYQINEGEEKEIEAGTTTTVEVVKNDIVIVKYKKEGEENKEITKQKLITELKVGYTLIYETNGGLSGPESVTQYDNSTFTISNVIPTKTGYNFVGWNTKQDGTGTSYNAGKSITITKKTTLYAIWEEISYTLIYDANGGSGAPTSVKQNNGIFTISNVIPTKTGYNFIEWNTKQDGTGTAYSAGKSITITINTTLYAIWEEAVNLVAWYDGINNTSNGHSYDVTTWTDLTGKNTKGGTLKNGATWSTNGVYFDGNNDWINLNSILMPESDNFTVEVVFSVNTYPTDDGLSIIGQIDSTAESSKRFGIRYNRITSDFGMRRGEDVVDSGYKPALNEKVTMAIIKNGNIQLWVNGVKKTEFAENGGDIYQIETVLGRWGMSPQNYFNGIIYSVKAYDGALSENKLKENYNSNVERFKDDTSETEQYSNYVKSDLSAWYDGWKNTSTGHSFTATTWTDLTGKNSTSPTLSGTTWRGNGLYFDGETDYVNMNSAIMPGSGNFTLEVVFSLGSYPTSSETYYIIGQNNSAGSSSVRLGVSYDGGTNEIRMRSGSNTIGTGFKLSVNEKVTATLVKNGNIQLWINGVKKAEFTETNAGISSYNTVLGKWGLYDDRYFEGKIYSLRKYDRALSSTELLQNYNVDKLRFDM